MKIHDLEVTGSLIYNGVNLLSLTSSVTDSGSFSTQVVNLNQVSSSLNSFTSSINTTIKSKLDSESVISGSAQVLITGTTGYSTFSSSISSSIGSLSGSVATTTSGLAGRITTIEGNYATTGSNIFVGSQVITGSLYITTDLIVQGSSSLQNITASAVSIGTNTVILNTDTPAVRFAGVSVQDSGSNAGVTGSIFWDGLCNRWVYSNPSGIGYSGGMLLSGPRTSTLGSESPLTCNYLAKSGGGDHLYDSCIYEMSGSVGINCSTPSYNLDVNGCGRFSDTLRVQHPSLWGAIEIVGSAANQGGQVDFYGGTTRYATITGEQESTNNGQLIYRTLRSSVLTNALSISSTGVATFAGAICVPNIISTGASGGRYGTFSAPANGGYITFDAGGTAFGDLGSYCAQYGTGDATTLLLGSRTGYALALGTNSVERIRITACGKIGIGTSNPCTELTVIGNVKAGYATNVGLIIGLSPVGVPNNDLNAYVIWGDATCFGGNNGDLIYIPRSSTSADHRFYTANAGLATEKVRFTYDGKVGIGTTTPDRKLDIASANAADTKLVIRTACGFAGAYSPSLDFHVGGYESTCTTGQIKMCGANNYSGDMIFSTQLSGTINPLVERMRIGSTGTFGFNCSGVAARTMIVKGATGCYIVAEFIEPSGVHSMLLYPNKNCTNHISSDYMSGGVYLPLSLSGRECTTDLVLGANGNIGINNSNPLTMLQVSLTPNAVAKTRNTCFGSCGLVFLSGLQGTSDSEVGIFGGNDFGSLSAGIGMARANSGDWDTQLRFYTHISSTSGNPADITEKMRITGDNVILMGTTSTSPSNSGGMIFRPTNAAYGGVIILNHSTTNNVGSGFLDLYYNTSYIGGIQQNGASAVLYNTSSDYRIKEDLKDFNGLEKISAIKVYDFKWKTEDTRSHGVIAHELQEVLPYVVGGEKDQLGEDGKLKAQGVDYGKLTPILIKAIQEQQCTICSQSQKIAILESCLGIM
jgi:hypothetical protein